MRASRRPPSDKDRFICPNCGHTFQHRAPYIYSPRRLTEAKIQIADTWNQPYSTGIYMLVKGDLSLKEIEEFASKHVRFDGWPVTYLGSLYAKETWDD